MKILAVLLLSVTQITLATAVDTPDEGAVPRMTAQEADQLQLALNRGLDLHRYDQAAWHATDALLEEIENPGSERIKGWIVEPVDQGWQVVFWAMDGEEYKAAFTAIYDGRKIISRQVFGDERPSLTEGQLALIAAQRATAGEVVDRCSDEPFNTVVFPTGNEDGGHFVYFLVPQTKAGSVPLGGHYRFEVVDGEIVNRRKFANSCIELGETRGRSETQPAAFFITHLLDPVPTEIHVFATFGVGRPINVMTSENGHIWVTEISGGQPRVRLLK